MNFQTVAANNGDFVAMFGTVIELGSQKLNVNSKPIQSVKLRDDVGDEHKVVINKGKGQLLPSDALGQRLAFNLSTYQGTGQNGVFTGYYGFWKDRTQVNQPPPQQSAPPPQRGQQRPPASPESGIKEMRIVRGNSLNATYSAIQIPLDMVEDYLLAGVGFILIGKWNLQNPPIEDDPNPHPSITEDERDIPF